jgi:hypothetical protein
MFDGFGIKDSVSDGRLRTIQGPCLLFQASPDNFHDFWSF